MTARVRCDFRGLPAVRLVTSDGSSAVVTEQGAQVVSWIPADGLVVTQDFVLDRQALGHAARLAPGEDQVQILVVAQGTVRIVAVPGTLAKRAL